MPVDALHRMHIDCLRGYAILMVIACHTVGQFKDLPWRFQQLVSSGWHGVQLFFVASTFTLLMSYDRELERDGHVNWGNFFLRRFFRIAPAYYFAAIVYCLIGRDRESTFVGTGVFAAFLNCWVPVSMGQALVPGAWSISVEFTFYVLFPLIATFFHTRVRAVSFLLASLVIALVVNPAVITHYPVEGYEHLPQQFVFFSFPNQLTVFALANLVYVAAYAPFSRLPEPVLASKRISLYRNVALYGSLLILLITPFLPLPQVFLPGNMLPPAFWWSSIWLAVICVTLAAERPAWLVNPVMARIGVVSFSAYLWHFAVLGGMAQSPWRPFLNQLSGIKAILAFPFVFLIATVLTYLCSYVTHAFIETPGIDLGKKIITWRRRRSVDAAPVPIQ